jgi:hypothetical protein
MTISTREEFLLFFFNKQVLVTKFNLRLLKYKIYILVIWYQLFKNNINFKLYRGADKSLARPVRKQAAATECFNTHISYLLTAYGLDGPGIESGGGEIFRTFPDRP